MGTSYQTLLVADSVPRVREVLADAGVEAWLAVAGEGRTAVMPREGDFDHADVDRVAQIVSRAGLAAMSNEVMDSDAVVMRAFTAAANAHGRNDAAPATIPSRGDPP